MSANDAESTLAAWDQSIRNADAPSDVLAATLCTAERLVLINEVALARQAATQIADAYEATSLEVAERILGELIERAATGAEHESVAEWALRTSEVALQSEQYDRAVQLARTGSGAAAASGNRQLRTRLNEHREAASAAGHVAHSLAAHLAPAADPTVDTTSSDPRTASLLARHYCLNLRRWEAGLPWMARGSDPRLGSLASDELALGPDAAPVAIAALARRWIEAAEHQRGRAADSLKLHGRDLLIHAAERSGARGEQELGQEIQRLEEILPADLVPLRTSLTWSFAP